MLNLQQQQQQQYQQGYFSQQVPLTPLDLSYSQLMLPANLLLGSPSPFVGRLQFLPLQPPSPLYQTRMMPPAPSPYPKLHSVPMLPYLAGSGPQPYDASSGVSRTVLLKNICADVLLYELLSQVDFGPIEYCKMFETPSPPHVSDVESVKTCYVSFVSSSVALAFFQKYGRNSHNLGHLRERLKSSRHLRVSLNEPTNATYGSSNLSKQDYIKLKTLNYIMELNATRAVQVLFKLSSLDHMEAARADFYEICGKYGEIDDYKSSLNELKLELTIVTHFTLIDSAIKIYEYHLKRIHIDHLNQLDLSDLEGSTKPDCICKSVQFHRDRCDRTDLTRGRRSLAQSAKNFSEGVSEDSSPSRALMRDSLAQVPESVEPFLPSARGLPNFGNDKFPPASPDLRDALDGDSSPLDDGSVLSKILSDSTDLPNVLPRQQYAASDPYLPGHSSLTSLPHSASNVSSGLIRMNMPQCLVNIDPFNVDNRIIYLGNLHPNSTVEEIANNVRAGGLVETIKFYPKKRMCFITFIDPSVALKFFLNHQVLHQLIIHGHNIRVAWGRNHSGPLNREIALAVTAGASRNVYIGLKPSCEAETKATLPSEETLREHFSKFGELEQINFYHNKDCGFMNFLSIMDAIKVVELFRSGNRDTASAIAEDNGEFYDLYSQFKISFGKDRCGNPPKFNFRKRSNVDRRDDRYDSGFEDSTNNFTEPLGEDESNVLGISEMSPPAVEADEQKDFNERLVKSTMIFEKEDLANGDDDGALALGISIAPIEGDDSQPVSQSSPVQASKPQRPRRSRQSSYDSIHNTFNYLRNSSAISLNSGYAQPHNYHSAHYLQSSPVPQKVYYQQHQAPILPHMRSFYGAAPPMAMPPNNYYKPLFASSGSQVMAQYLAKSQHDGYLYAASILNDDGRDDQYEPRRQRRTLLPKGSKIRDFQ